jgi:hypothetical protein
MLLAGQGLFRAFGTVGDRPISGVIANFGHDKLIYNPYGVLCRWR